MYYTFWRDATHEKGVWQRTTPEEYRKANPKWEVAFDLDALAKEEGVSWVWKGSVVLHEGRTSPRNG